MKKLAFFLVSVLLLTSCTKSLKVLVTNPINLDRTNEIVSVPLQNIVQKLQLTANKQFVIVDQNGKQIPYQIEADSLSVIFLATVKANGTSDYTIRIGKPEAFAPMTFGRYVPERKDDFAWENDRIAYRMYGPALADENPSNGVDVWLKRTDSLIVNKFYQDDANGKPYHIDHGQGLDCYKVAHTLGAGGITPYTDTTLWVGNHYSTWKVIENGPLRTTFVLTYDSVQVDKTFLKEKLTISLDAGSQLNKGTVTYEGTLPPNFQVATGITLHDNKGVMKSDQKAGYIAYAETATSDDGVPSGRDYIGVIVPESIESVKVQDDHLLAIESYLPQQAFTYYFGAGWSKWGFPSDQAWFDYMQQFSQKLQNPLQVTLQ